MRFHVDITTSAPREVVWDVLVDWERQPEWMLDAKSVEVVSAGRTGVGVTIRCPTNLLGVTVEDVMRVTEWQEQERLAVIHLGRIITGSGAFELSDDGTGTHIRWWEEVDPPLGAVGEWGASTLVQPIVKRIFRASLRRLAALAEAEAVRRRGIQAR